MAGQRYLVAAERGATPAPACGRRSSVERPLPAPRKQKNWLSGDVVRKSVQGWMALLGPVTSRTLGARLGMEPAAIWAAMLVMEMQGTILRGVFEGAGNWPPRRGCGMVRAQAAAAHP
jgi:ATP-dependent Lhr-like helicase